MKIHALVILSFAALQALVAQPNPVRIYVVNKLTGTPIPGATVAFEGTADAKVWGRTDAGGIFTGQVVAGQHVLSVSRKGLEWPRTSSAR